MVVVGLMHILASWLCLGGQEKFPRAVPLRSWGPMIEMCYAKSSLQGIIMLILCSSINRSGAAKPFTSRVLPNSAKPEQACGIPQSTATGRLEKSQLVPLPKVEYISFTERWESVSRQFQCFLLLIWSWFFILFFSEMHKICVKHSSKISKVMSFTVC